MPTGKVHDEDDQGMKKNGIGYIDVSNIHGNPTSRTQHIPFIQGVPKIKKGECVEFETAEYDLIPTSGAGPSGTIKIAVEVKVVDC